MDIMDEHSHPTRIRLNQHGCWSSDHNGWFRQWHTSRFQKVSSGSGASRYCHRFFLNFSQQNRNYRHRKEGICVRLVWLKTSRTAPRSGTVRFELSFPFILYLRNTAASCTIDGHFIVFGGFDNSGKPCGDVEVINLRKPNSRFSVWKLLGIDAKSLTYQKLAHKSTSISRRQFNDTKV